MQKLLDRLQENPFILAPMAGITDCAFRSFMTEMGASLVITELVSATGLKYSSERTRKLMQFTKDQHPVGIQIFGDSLEDLDFAAKEVEQMGADFVDLNFGCPVPKVVKKGAGSAILKDLVQLRKVLKTVKSAVNIPVTIKIRTGWDEKGKNAIEVAKIAAEEGILWVAIHGRTRAQSYSGQSDWSYIAEVKKQSSIPIIGNGDLTSATKTLDKLHKSNCDAVMIGRGCLKNPWIFIQSLQLNGNEIPENYPKDFNEVFERLSHHLRLHCDERIIGLQLKKMAAWYSHGFEGSSNFRKQIFQSKGLSEVQDVISSYFVNREILQQEDTSHQAFLMGGHG